MKLIEFIYAKFRKFYRHKKWGQLVLLSIGVLCSLIAIALVILGLLTVIYYNWETIITLVFVITVLYVGISDAIKERREEKERQLAEQREIQEQIDKSALENNYMVLCSVIFAALQNVYDILGLKMPITENDLDSANHYLNQGTFYLYQFVIYRKSSLVDMNVIKASLQEEIIRNMTNGHFSGLGKQTYFLYEGMAKPYIDIYAVNENPAYITLSLAIASDEYYHFKNLQQNNSLALARQSKVNTYDKDF